LASVKVVAETLTF